MPVLKNNVIKSLTLPRLLERHQATLDELMQWFSRIITDINALESEFLEYQATPEDEFLLILTRMISARALITSATKYLNKVIYTLINLILNTLQNFLNFYF